MPYINIFFLNHPGDTSFDVSLLLDLIIHAFNLCIYLVRSGWLWGGLVVSASCNKSYHILNIEFSPKRCYYSELRRPHSSSTSDRPYSQSKLSTSTSLRPLQSQCHAPIQWLKVPPTATLNVCRLLVDATTPSQVLVLTDPDDLGLLLGCGCHLQPVDCIFRTACQPLCLFTQWNKIPNVPHHSIHWIGLRPLWFMVYTDLQWLGAFSRRSATPWAQTRPFLSSFHVSPAPTGKTPLTVLISAFYNFNSASIAKSLLSKKIKGRQSIMLELPLKF